MKKTYIAPSVEVIKVNAVNMLATSSMGFGETELPASNQLGRDFDSPFSPDIWTKEW